MLDDIPDDIGVHGKVVVNQDVSHTHYLRPGYALLTVAKFLRQSTYRFTNNLKMSYKPVLNEFIRLERPSTTRSVAFDNGYPIKDIPESFLRVSHTGIASFKTRSRMRVLSPRSVTTSTS